MGNIVYALFDPRTQEIRYIGASTRGVERPQEHMYGCGKGYAGRWVRSLLKRGIRPGIRVLEVVESGDVFARERWWIARYRERGARLINLTDGGEGSLGRKLTQQQREHMSKVNNRVVTPEGRLRISQANKGRKHTPEERARRGAALKGREFSDDHKRKISASLMGRVVGDETRKKMSESAKRRWDAATRARASERAKARRHTAETRHKMSASQKKRYAS